MIPRVVSPIRGSSSNSCDSDSSSSSRSCMIIMEAKTNNRKKKDAVSVAAPQKTKTKKKNNSGRSAVLRQHQQQATAALGKSFPHKVYNMLEYALREKDLTDICCWDPSGTAFVVFHPGSFMETLVKKFFPNQSTYRSFERQLNIWGFVRTNAQTKNGFQQEDSPVHSYSHKYFIRGQPQLIKGNVVRKQTGTSAKSIKKMIMTTNQNGNENGNNPRKVGINLNLPSEEAKRSQELALQFLQQQQCPKSLSTAAAIGNAQSKSVVVLPPGIPLKEPSLPLPKAGERRKSAPPSTSLRPPIPSITMMNDFPMIAPPSVAPPPTAARRKSALPSTSLPPPPPSINVINNLPIIIPPRTATVKTTNEYHHQQQRQRRNQINSNINPVAGMPASGDIAQRNVVPKPPPIHIPTAASTNAAAAAADDATTQCTLPPSPLQPPTRDQKSIAHEEEKSGRWTKEEHNLFLRGLEIFGKGNWENVAALIKSRTIGQVRSHAQKYFATIDKTSLSTKSNCGQRQNDENVSRIARSQSNGQSRTLLLPPWPPRPPQGQLPPLVPTTAHPNQEAAPDTSFSNSSIVLLPPPQPSSSRVVGAPFQGQIQHIQVVALPLGMGHGKPFRTWRKHNFQHDSSDRLGSLEPNLKNYYGIDFGERFN